MPKTISCPHVGCDYLFSKPVHLRRHLLSHSDEAVWKCPDCDQEFKRIDSFQRHKKRIHPDQPNLAAVRIGGDADADSSAKSDDEADDQIDDLDISMRDDDAKPFISVKRGATSPLSRGATASASATSHQMSSYNTPSALSNQQVVRFQLLVAVVLASSWPSYRSRAVGLHVHPRADHYHPYQRSDSAPQAAQSNNGRLVRRQSQPVAIPAGNSRRCTTRTTAAASSSFSFYPNLYGAPISYNGYAAASSSSAGADALAVANSYGSAASGDASQDSRSALDSIAHCTVSLVGLRGPGDALGAKLVTGAAAEPADAAPNPAAISSSRARAASTAASATTAGSQNQGQSAQSAEVQSATATSGSQQQQQQQPPQPLVNLVPFATFTDSAHNSGAVDAGDAAPCACGHGRCRRDDALGGKGWATRRRRTLGRARAIWCCTASTSPRSRRGSLPPRSSAPPRGIRGRCCRCCRRTGCLTTVAWLPNGRTCSSRCSRWGRFGSPRADVKAYGAELWQLIFRSIWAGAVFYPRPAAADARGDGRHGLHASVRVHVPRREHPSQVDPQHVYGQLAHPRVRLAPRSVVPRRAVGRVAAACAWCQHSDGAGGARGSREGSEHQQAIGGAKEAVGSAARRVEAVVGCGGGESQHDLPRHHRVAPLGVSHQPRTDAQHGPDYVPGARAECRRCLGTPRRRSSGRGSCWNTRAGAKNHQRPLLAGKRQLGPILDALWGGRCPLARHGQAARLGARAESWTVSRPSASCSACCALPSRSTLRC
ncbi:hypothetical protein L1887_46821 [Cichorium endivia]|nr:hypothetical protein L1887_46821 [Cichorium endivia]